MCARCYKELGRRGVDFPELAQFCDFHFCSSFVPCRKSLRSDFTPALMPFTQSHHPLKQEFAQQKSKTESSVPAICRLALFAPSHSVRCFHRSVIMHAAPGGGGRVPWRTCRRSNYCGFAEVLGLFRAELSGTNIGFRDFKMTAWSFRTSLAKWDALTRPGW